MCIAGAFVCLFLVVVSPLAIREVVTESTSPDGRYRIVVIQPKLVLLDRNFRVELIDKISESTQVIFKSFDQSPSIREEYFVWTNDSRWVALIGDEYYVASGSGLPNGLTLFLAYDIENDRVYCNTDYLERGFPQMTVGEAVRRFGENGLEAPTP